MKNHIKLSFLVAAVCFSLAACKGKNSSSSSDSVKSVDSSSTKVGATVDTAKKDTGMKMGPDTSKKVDTVKKSTTTTEKKKVKKTE